MLIPNRRQKQQCCRGRQYWPVIGWVFILLVSQLASAEKLMITDFSRQSLAGFEEKSFAGYTDYQSVVIQGRPALRAETNGQASALFLKIPIDLQKTPYLNWSWRVDAVYPITNQQQKSGDDFPARIYVVFKEGFFPWQTKALNYVWSNIIEDKSFWPNPFTGKAVMIPVRSGSDGLKRWHSERVNVADDFYRVFGRRINKAHGVAIMSDSDNAKGAAVAYYANVFFSD